MNKIELKIIFRSILQHKYYSIFSILGIALTFVFLTMTFMYVRLKTGNVAPDIYKDRTIKVDYLLFDDGTQQDIDSVKLKYYLQMKSPEYISFVNMQTPSLHKKGKYIIGTTAYTNASYFNIFSLNFLQGRPFNIKEEINKDKVIVISESFAHSYFAHSNVLGEKIELQGDVFTVVGVVDKANVFSEAGSYDLYVPYVFDKFSPNRYFHHFIYLKAKNKESLKSINDELIKLHQAFYTSKIVNSPVKIKEWETMDKKSFDTSSTLVLVTIVGLLMLIPAFNILSLNTSKIQDQLKEISIKRAYGSTRSKIFREIFIENTIITFIGASIGLLLTSQFSFLYRFESLINQFSLMEIPYTMTLDYFVIIIISMLIIIFSLISCMFPAWSISRNNIVKGIKGEIS